MTEYASGLISSDIRFECVKGVGMIQNGNGGWVSTDNYVNLSRQLDAAVEHSTQLTAALAATEQYRLGMLAAAEIVEQQIVGTMTACFPLCADTLEHCAATIRSATEGEERCEWRFLGEGWYHAGCRPVKDEEWAYNEDWRVCPYCGKPLTVKENA